MSSQWRSIKAKAVLRALEKIGWKAIRQTGSHRILSREGWGNFVFAFHDREELAPRCLHEYHARLGCNPKICSGGLSTLWQSYKVNSHFQLK